MLRHLGTNGEALSSSGDRMALRLHLNGANTRLAVTLWLQHGNSTSDWDA